MASLKPMWLSVGSLSARLQRADSLYLGLDFDGTLASLGPDPRRTALPQRTREVLERLSRCPGSHLAILSSRALDDLWQRAGIENVFYAGCSGLETRDEQGHRETHASTAITMPAALLRELEGWCERFPGARLETQVNSCTLFFSAVAPSLQPAFGAGVRRRVHPHLPSICLVHGRTGFEVRPAGGWDKAMALERWLDPGGSSSSLVFYLGDDTRDEPVHEAVRKRGGIAIAVGRLVSHAEFALPTPEEVTWFLEWLEREWVLRCEPAAVRR
jgi:trehalose-phosphatase